MCQKARIFGENISIVLFYKDFVRILRATRTCTDGHRMTGVSAATAWRDIEDLLYVMRRKSLPIATFKSLSGISD